MKESPMSIPYGVIEVFTSEQARREGKPLSHAIVDFVHAQKVAARCIVTRGVAGCYENGEVATQGIEVLSYNMPLKIEIIAPMPEIERMRPAIQEMVGDGIVVVEEMRMCSHRTHARLLPRQLRVRDAMTPAPAHVSPGTPIRETVQAMLQAKFNGMPVVDDAQRPVGIVTQGDLIRRAGLPVRKGLLAQFDQGQIQEYVESLKNRTTAEVMTQPVATIQEDKPLTDAVELMLKKKIKRLPVVDQKGQLVGMLARFDIFRTISRETPTAAVLKTHRVELQNARTAAEIMDTGTPTVLPDAPIEDVIRLIDTSEVQCVAVVDTDGKFLGLVSDQHVLQAFAEHRVSLWRHLTSKLSFTELGKHQRHLIAQLSARSARDVMRADALTVSRDTPVDEAIRIMVEKSIKYLPVLDADRRFLGLLSRDGIMRQDLSRS
jgi:CBS domain-containing protein